MECLNLDGVDLAVPAGAHEGNCMEAILLVVIALARVGNFSVVLGEDVPPPLADGVFVNVVSHVWLLGDSR